MPQYTKCACQAISIPDTSLKFTVPFFFSPLLYLKFSARIPVWPTSFGSMFLLFFYFYFCTPFVCQTWRIASLPFLRHLISCLLLCWTTKRLYPLQTVHCFWRDVLLNCALHAGHVRFFFSFSFFMSFFCRMTPAWHSYFIYELLTFLGHATKKWQDWAVRAFLLRWSVRAPPVRRCSGCAAHSWWKATGGDPGVRGRGADTRLSSWRKITNPFPGALVCCFILLFKVLGFFVCFFPPILRVTALEPFLKA